MPTKRLKAKMDRTTAKALNPSRWTSHIKIVSDHCSSFKMSKITVALQIKRAPIIEAPIGRFSELVKVESNNLMPNITRHTVIGKE